MISNFKRDLSSRLYNYQDQEFTLVINNKLMMVDKYIGRVRLSRLSKTPELQIGHRKSVNGSPRFVTSEELENDINKEISEYTIGRFDFTSLNSGRLLMDVDVDLKIVYVNTSVHKQCLTILKEDRNTGLKFTTAGGEVVSLNAIDVREVKSELLTEMYVRYREICQNLLLKKLSTARSANFNEIKFFKTQKAFVPVLLQGSFIFNPLLEVPSIFNLFKETDFYKACIGTKHITVGTLGVYYLTHLEICKAIHIDRFAKFTPALMIALLFSEYIPGIADDATNLYVPRNEYKLDAPYKVLDEKSLIMMPDIQYMYEGVSALYYACYLVSGKKDVASKLYNIIRGYKL